MSLTGRFLFALLSATIPHSFAMTSRATTRALTFSSPTQRQFTSFIRRSLSNQIDIIPTTSTTTPHHDGRRMVQLTWPKCSKAKYYRITSMSDDKSKSFSLFSTVQYQSKWTIGQSQNQLTVTPIDNQGNEILDSKLIQRIVHENQEKSTKTAGASPQHISPPKTSTPILSEISYLDIKIGKIIDIKVHPEADSLYIESIDVGEAQPRVIVSGLVKYCTKEELLNRSVVVLCNLKPRLLKGVMSYGMLLCASNTDHTEVEPILPPPNSVIGEKIQFDGYVSQPSEPSNRVNKAFERVVNELQTSSDGIATYQGKSAFMTSLGPCVSRIKGAKIS